MPLRASLHRNPASGRWSSRNSKRKEVLSVNMISLPLADFRHITHIGNNADSFGDLSFLKLSHNLLLQSSRSEQNIFLACSPPPKPPRLNLDETETKKTPDLSVDHQHNNSQKRKKCSSLPLLDSEKGNVDAEKEDGYQRGNNTSSNQTHSSRWGSTGSDGDEDFNETCDKTTGQQKDEDSGFSFSLDLGPSILDDVLQVMDKLHK